MRREHRRVRHHAQQIAARHRAGRQLEQREHGLADPAAVVERRVDQVTRHADRFERRRSPARGSAPASPAIHTAISCARSVGSASRCARNSRRDRPRARGARSGTRARVTPALGSEPRGRRCARDSLRRHPRASRCSAVAGRLVDERIVDIAAGALDERAERVARRRGPTATAAAGLRRRRSVAAFARPETSSHSSAHGSSKYTVTSPCCARSVSASSCARTRYEIPNTAIGAASRRRRQPGAPPRPRQHRDRHAALASEPRRSASPTSAACQRAVGSSRELRRRAADAERRHPVGPRQRVLPDQVREVLGELHAPRPGAITRRRCRAQICRDRRQLARPPADPRAPTRSPPASCARSIPPTMPPLARRSHVRSTNASNVTRSNPAAMPRASAISRFNQRATR